MAEDDRSITIDTGIKKIKIASEVVNIISSHKQLNYKDCESGGILVGRENIESGNIVIEYATEPYPKDRGTRTRFYRKDKKHIEFFEKLHMESKGIYAYLGEWHTHAEEYPEFSSVDSDNWRRIAKENKDRGKEFYHIIVGTKEIRAWMYSKELLMISRIL